MKVNANLRNITFGGRGLNILKFYNGTENRFYCISAIIDYIDVTLNFC